MKREFLQNFKVGDQPLSKEIIDSIMDENGRDIETAKKPFADYDTIKAQLEEARETINGFKDSGVDAEQLRQKAQEWEDKYNAAIDDSRKKIASMEFDHALEAAITRAKGKNAKAIRALLDVETLRESKNQEADIKSAIETVRNENDYLFDGEQTPPPYSGGTGVDRNGGSLDGVEAAFAALNPGLKLN